MVPAWRSRCSRTVVLMSRAVRRMARISRRSSSLWIFCYGNHLWCGQPCRSLAAGGEDDRVALGDRDGVLGVGASGAVPAAEGPAVRVGVDLVGALAEPRFDG